MRLQPVLVATLFLMAVSISLQVLADEQAPPIASAPFDAKAAVQFQKDWATYLKVDLETKNSIGMPLRLIPAGEFTMGSPKSETNRDEDEVSHVVRISKPFYLGQHEVTQGEWNAVMKFQPWKGKGYTTEGANHPATHIDWDSADNFCKVLSEKEGKTYRLPTEAEWEFACRAGPTTAYPFGNDDKDLVKSAWFGSNVGENGEKFTHPVNQKLANPFGLHDMSGNVWEWCADWLDEKYYSKSPKSDPQGAASGEKRVYRGGGWIHHSSKCRSAARSGYFPIYKSNAVGFRVVRVLPGK